jgi:hypothetical protein
MSEEVFPRKLGEGLVPESSPTVIETNKQKREGLILVCLVAVGVVIVPVASIVLLPYVMSLEGNIFGSISRSTIDTVVLMHSRRLLLWELHSKQQMLKEM